MKLALHINGDDLGSPATGHQLVAMLMAHTIASGDGVLVAHNDDKLADGMPDEMLVICAIGREHIEPFRAYLEQVKASATGGPTP